VRFEGVSKRFHLRDGTTVKEVLPAIIRRGGVQSFLALKDIDFAVAQGETVGIVGRNGSGKSTLLKLIAGVMQPTTGHVLTRGRIAPLIELGACFHSDLTGRENVFLNASILGVPDRESRALLDDIVAFAELEKFIDTPVKRYSSGMSLRLAFAVAIHSHPDILLVDEAMAVGDKAFQEKCLGRMRQSLLLESGSKVGEGAPKEIVARYAAMS
jgi:ABC-2 type transport system ATP-binding protein